MSDRPVQVTYDGTEDFMRAIAELTGYQVMVGIPSDSASRGGPITNAVLGYIHEFGSHNIPARPFLIPTIERIHDRAASMMRTAAEFHMDHRPDQAMSMFESLGMLAAAEVKKTITAGGDPVFTPLATSTVAARRRRGNQAINPLIDFSLPADEFMIQAITYVVRKK